jgi:uncharacterized protein (TIGR03085 family)
VWAVTGGRYGSARPTITVMSRFAQTERRAMADLMATLGPDAPTMCEGWQTRDLAAHVVLRERRPDAAAAMYVPPTRSHGKRVQRALAARPYEELVALVREPPWWSPVSNPLTDGVANTLEFFIHHEDVRRGQPGWRPRDLPRVQQEALWKRAKAIARLRLRTFPAALLVQAPGYGEVSTGAGGDTVRLIGAPGELVYFLAGRQRATRVQVDGPPALTDRLRGARLKI